MSSLRDDQGLLQPPEVNLHLEVRLHSAPMKLALVAGVRPDGDCMRWTVIAPDGTQTRTMKGARLYAFTKAGRDAASTDAKALKALLACGDRWIDFVWRVLVEGPWERPEAVTPVWIIEGHARPVPVPYYFD